MERKMERLIKKYLSEEVKSEVAKKLIAMAKAPYKHDKERSELIKRIKDLTTQVDMIKKKV
jgi:hypothetical protein